MALNTVIPFPIFAPISTTTSTAATSTVVRFSRWNNANAEHFNRRPQQLIEDDIRRYRRFQTALNIANNYTPPPSSPPPPPPYKSIGTPSSPSLSSIPGKKSKYSKVSYRNTPSNPNYRQKSAQKPAFRDVSKRSKFPGDETADNGGNSGETAVRVSARYSNPNYRDNSAHPAFRRALQRSKLPRERETAESEESAGVPAVVKVSDQGGLSYVVPGAPFEYMYSYTESVKGVKPVALREAAVAPFGPGTMPRPWTGRKPLPGTKKLLPEFDSFQPPPAGKKGVKSVQNPGPYLPGSGPRYVMTREEILGEELTQVEVNAMVETCRKTKRQLNMGRDGLTHNMLDNIHAHWKRRRVCKIKCKGVCTVDMDNVCQQLEEKTGGKIIFRRGGVVFLFRGRNYNYKTRPRFPLMLWKPVSPVYPRLVKQVPEGLTSEEATEMRKRGRDLIPICKLGKNGVYVNLVKTVREAFEVCDLVRVNCQGLNPSDYRKIGAKLKDLVPCVLISFEFEHILMWRGKDWSPSIMQPETDNKGYQISESDRDAFLGPDTSDPTFSDDEQESESISSNIPNCKTFDEIPTSSEVVTNDSDVGVMAHNDAFFVKDDVKTDFNSEIPSQTNDLGTEDVGGEISDDLSDDAIKSGACSGEREPQIDIDFGDVDPTSAERISDSEVVVGSSSGCLVANGELDPMVENIQESSPSLVSPCTEGVLHLLTQALDSGRALTLDDTSLDADIVYEKSVAFAQVAPPGPAFEHRPRKVAILKSENQQSVVAEGDTAMPEPAREMKSSKKTPKERKSPRIKKTNDLKEEFLDVVPQGSLKIDELAKLLA
ncbi:hypothetical protein RND81_07G093600 [Saponaria officinalis]|uniref:CRM domain-containing protein n=1 Tax=Saponaria officinalis TaxID=3572 RepID=A0AAW1JPZ5_SAPOF